MPRTRVHNEYLPRRPRRREHVTFDAPIGGAERLFKGSIAG